MSYSYDQLRVLVVEDNQHTRALIRSVLQNLGFNAGHIREAFDGLSALEELQKEAVHIVISDWRMEPMDGLTFVRTLRDPEKSPDPFVPVILCSAYTDQELIESARDIGINEIIAKPISIGNIKSRIHAILDKPRPFVNASNYFGPDRRRRRGPVTTGQERRGEPGTKPRGSS